MLLSKSLGKCDMLDEYSNVSSIAFLKHSLIGTSSQLNVINSITIGKQKVWKL